MIECALQEKGKDSDPSPYTPKLLNRKRQFYCRAIGNSCEYHGFMVIEVPFHSRCSICYKKTICIDGSTDKDFDIDKKNPKTTT